MKTAVKQHVYQLRTVEIALMVGLAIFLGSGVLALRTQDELADKVVRLHVLANSDSEEDQALKLKVRDVVLERATAILEQSADRREAESRLRGELLELERIAAEEVAAEGYYYPAGHSGRGRGKELVVCGVPAAVYRRVRRCACVCTGGWVF